MNPFTSFAFTCEPDVFNEPIGNTYLPVGKHNVRVTSAEIVNGQYGLQLKLQYANDQNHTANSMFNLIAKPDPAKPGVFPHFMYLSFGQAAFSDPVIRAKLLMNVLPSNTALAADLKGLQLTIEITPPTKGYTVKDVGDRKVIYDVATNEIIGDESFESFEAAKAKAEALGLKRGYSNVNKLTATSDAARQANDVIGKALIDSLSTTTAPRVRPASI